MKKITTLLLLSFFCVTFINAQEKKEHRNKIRTLKIAFITEQLELTENEAQKFWPIYNKYDKKQHRLRNELRTKIHFDTNKEEKIDSLTEKDAEILVDLKLSIDRKIYESNKDFLSKIKSVISYKKILKLQVAEMEFGRKLMRRYKRKDNRRI